MKQIKIKKIKKSLSIPENRDDVCRHHLRSETRLSVPSPEPWTSVWVQRSVWTVESFHLGVTQSGGKCVKTSAEVSKSAAF